MKEFKTQATTSNNWNIGRSHKTGFPKAEKLSDADYGATKTVSNAAVTQTQWIQNGKTARPKIRQER